jgi:pyruvate dehydrogenase E2 component (dihydrolipoamide acetyltransferase)
MFGLSFGLAPLVPLSRVPIIVLVGEVQNRAWVEGDRVTARPILILGCTFDHRLIDGAQGGKMAALLRSVVEDPEHYLEGTKDQTTEREPIAADAFN